MRPSLAFPVGPWFVSKGLGSRSRRPRLYLVPWHLLSTLVLEEDKKRGEGNGSITAGTSSQTSLVHPLFDKLVSFSSVQVPVAYKEAVLLPDLLRQWVTSSLTQLLTWADKHGDGKFGFVLGPCS
jgi:hypothetical protein